MEEKSKSLKQFIKVLLKDFDYEDFSPPVDLPKLRDKLKKILSTENAFWEQYDPSFIQHQTAPFIRIKSFEDQSVSISFHIGEKSMSIQVLEFDFNGKAFVYTKESIDLRAIWLDHEVFVDKLSDVIERSVKFVHQKTDDGKFPESQAVIQ